MKTIKDHHEAIHTLQALHDFITKQEHVQYLYESSCDEADAEIEQLEHYNQTLRDENAMLRNDIELYKQAGTTKDSKHLESELLQAEYQVQALESELDMHVATIVDLKQQLKAHQTPTPVDVIFEIEGLRETVYQLGCEVGKLQQQAKLNRFLKA